MPATARAAWYLPFFFLLIQHSLSNIYSDASPLRLQSAADSFCMMSLQRKWMFPTQRMLSREDDPSSLFPSDFFANINSNKDEQAQDAWRIKVLKMSFQNFWLLFLFILIKMNLYVLKLKSSTDIHPFLTVSSNKNQLFIHNSNYTSDYILWLVTSSVWKRWHKISDFVSFRWFLELIFRYLRRLSMNDFNIDVIPLV